MKQRPPVLLSLVLVAAYLAPGTILQVLLHLQGTSMRPAALLVASLAGALIVVFPISYLVLPRVLLHRRLAGAAPRVRLASLYAIQPVLAFLPAWYIAAYFGADTAPRILLTAGGTAVLLLLTDSIFRSLGYGIFEE